MAKRIKIVKDISLGDNIIRCLSFEPIKTQNKTIEITGTMIASVPKDSKVIINHRD